MKLNTFITATIILFCTAFEVEAQDSLMIRKIYDEALVNGKCYENLNYLCKNIGPRLSGSANAQKAINWGKKLMEIIGNQKIPVPICALGMSMATPNEGITANVIEVSSLKQLDTLGEAVIKGNIVFFNRPFDPRFIETGRAYGTAGDQRFMGPAAAAKYGAVGAIVRSLTEIVDDYPHTGATLSNGKTVPAAAISTKAADILSILLKGQKKNLKFSFKQYCKLLPDTLSYNVVAEMTGS